MGGLRVHSLEESDPYAGATHRPATNAGVHKKESTEQDAAASQTAATESPPADTADAHVQSSHLSLKTHATRLKTHGFTVYESVADLRDMHKKTSEEQSVPSGRAPGDLPARYPPIEAAPRAPGFSYEAEEGEEGGEENEEGEECKSVNGKYGSAGSEEGVIVRYEYELTVDARSSGGRMTKETLPALEAGITDKLVPLFFPEECGASTRRLQRDEEDEETRRLRGQRTLGQFVGVDADPRDVVLAQKKCSADGALSNAQWGLADAHCHSVEGALTLHLPPHSDQALLQEAKVATLDAIRESMADGSLAEAHEGILAVRLLDSSYELAPAMPDDAFVQSDGGGGSGGDKGGLVAGILVPLLLLLLCCCGGLLGWRRSGRSIADAKAAALPAMKTKNKPKGEGEKMIEGMFRRKDGEAAQDIESSGRKRLKRTLQSLLIYGRTSDGQERAEEGERFEDLDPMAQRLIEDLHRESRRRARRQRREDKKKRRCEEEEEAGGQRSGLCCLDVIDEESGTDGDTTDEDEEAHRNSATTESSSATGDLRSSTTSSQSGFYSTTSTEGSTGSSRGAKERLNSSASTSYDSEGSEESTSSSDEESEDGDHFDFSAGFLENLEQQVDQMQELHATFVGKRQEARWRSAGEGKGAAARYKPTSANSNLVIAGKHSHDEASVMTGVTGATGMHSLSSQATEQAANKKIPSSIGGDGASATRKDPHAAGNPPRDAGPKSPEE